MEDLINLRNETNQTTISTSLLALENKSVIHNRIVLMGLAGTNKILPNKQFMIAACGRKVRVYVLIASQ